MATRVAPSGIDTNTALPPVASVVAGLGDLPPGGEFPVGGGELDPLEFVVFPEPPGALVPFVPLPWEDPSPEYGMAEMVR